MKIACKIIGYKPTKNPRYVIASCVSTGRVYNNFGDSAHRVLFEIEPEDKIDLIGREVSLCCYVNRDGVYKEFIERR